MRIDLTRSFSLPSDEHEDTEDWFRYSRNGRGDYSWSELHERRVVVILGEAGIGKTLEFQNEVDRLQHEDKAAFFIPLNQMSDRESWGLVLSSFQPRFDHWEQSTDTGYFFLDAVDEARLISHSAFERALMVVRAGLGRCLPRVRISISSRVTDWAVESVRDSVKTHLTDPISAAAHVVDFDESDGHTLDTHAALQETPADQVDTFVVSIDPLSRLEAQKLADAFGVQDSAGFWNAIEDGDYEFMATRPLDLGWMVNLWNEKNSLGSYFQLIDTNVSNRLVDVNPSYQQAGASLSLEILRSGAEQLASATEFSGRPFVSTTETAAANEILPSGVLSDWKPVDTNRLLGSAVFDEATFGRVKFHHRSIREYLAASWVDRQLRLGLPLHRVLSLFTAEPFGIKVLILSRRAALCWLAALNVEVREWVAREFPEMLIFEGDPEAWDLATAKLAFTGYIERVKTGLRTNWWNSESEFRRLARRLPPGLVAELLVNQQSDPRVIKSLLPLVKHGRLQDCGQVVFEMYQRPQASAGQVRLALITLAAIAAPEHRQTIKEDLLAGRLQSNELIAAALSVTDWATFTVRELASVFTRSEPDSTLGTGTMAWAVKEDLLPETDAASAELLLSAIIAALPAPERGQRFARSREMHPPQRVWQFNVLSDCTERLLSLLPPGSDQVPDVCVEAAERIEAIRHSGFVNENDLHKIHVLITERPALRWKIASEIAQSEEISHAASRLTWGASCLVSFNKSDLPELITRANDTNTPPELRNIWFEIGMHLAIHELNGHARRAALMQLLRGPDHESRAQRVSTEQSQWLSGLKQRRLYNIETRTQKREKRQQHIRDGENLSHDIEHIRDGSYTETLNWLIGYSFNQSGRDSLTHVDFNIITQDFSSAIAEALASGLVTAWSQIVPPNPANHRDGRIPWDTIRGLAGLHVLLEGQTDIANLNDADAARAAQLAIWKFNSPPSWFERLLETHESVVLAALHPWIEAECADLSNEGIAGRALDLALRSPSPVRRRLLQPVVPLLLSNGIPNQERFKALLDALREDMLLDATSIAEICKSKVEGCLNSEGLVSELGWLRTWIEEDLQSAWAWFERHVVKLGTAAGQQVHELARALVDKKWLKTPVSEGDAAVLVQAHRLLTIHLRAPRTQTSNDDENGILGSPVARLRDSIPKILVQVRGAAANHALVELASGETKPIAKEWLNTLVVEHAEYEAQQLAPITPLQLKVIWQPYEIEPRSEHALFQQVLGRLEAIRVGLEEGPFSDRFLFPAGIDEKYLQLWLAARFRDTTNRKFSVHREEELHDENMPDIQLSCQYGNVCLEIKPLDRERSYSAKSLAGTLRTQLVGKYLKGLNSTHGILILFRLDDKKWKIPDETKLVDFAELLAYLRVEANAIKDDNPGIEALTVFGINCINS